MAEFTTTDEQRLAEFSAKLDSFKPEGFDDEAFSKLKEAVVSFHKGEVQGLKINTAKMKEEKEALSQKLSASETSFNDLFEKNKILSEQLAANQPEELKKVYENQQKQLQEVFSKKESEYTATIQKQSEYIKQLEKSDLEKDVLSEFNKYANGKDWLGGGREIAQSYIVGEMGEKFSRLTVDGKVMLVNKDSQSIEQAFNHFCETDVGKHLLKSGSSGGGADGSGSNLGSGDSKKMKLADYNRMSAEEQMNFSLAGGEVI